MRTVRLGNPQPVDARTRQLLEGGERVTDVRVPDTWPDGTPVPISEQLRSIAHDDGGPNCGLWPVHSAAAGPSWVESDSPELAEAIARHYGCPIGQPTTATQEGRP